MKKQLNVDIVTNELRQGSAFFPRKRKESNAHPQPDGVSPLVPEPQAAIPSEAAPRPVPPVPPVRVVPPVPPVRGKKRVMKQRHPFDIYRDQYEALQALALEERMQGGVGSMSAMVREAIDALLEKRRKK